jgi:hypothetical protein
MLRTGAATVIVGVLFTGVDVPPPDTVSAMLIGVPFADVTFPVTVMGGNGCPAATELLYVQVVVDNVHVQFVPEIAVTVNPVGGSTKVTVPVVAPVPLLVTWIA